ncbi:MAG: RluA family pseudouridine synthase [Flavobacteriales bacterium]
MKSGEGSGTGTPQPIDPSRILYEDNHLIVVHKKAGDIVQGDRTGDIPLSRMVKDSIKERYSKPGNVYLGVVHRLDRPVSGVLLFAKTSKALSRLNKAFQEKRTEKVYWVVVEGIHEGRNRLEDHLIKNERKNKSRIVGEKLKRSRKAALRYEVVGLGDRYSLLEVIPETGRHHQIRVQLADRGMPIKGDVKYGARRPNKDASIHLHARSLAFPHPTDGSFPRIEDPAPVGDALWELFMKMRDLHS